MISFLQCIIFEPISYSEFILGLELRIWNKYIWKVAPLNCGCKFSPKYLVIFGLIDESMRACKG